MAFLQQVKWTRLYMYAMARQDRKDLPDLKVSPELQARLVHRDPQGQRALRALRVPLVLRVQRERQAQRGLQAHRDPQVQKVWSNQLRSRQALTAPLAEEKLKPA